MNFLKFKRTLFTMILLATLMTAVTGGTIAWFTDSVTSTGNIIQSGTLDVEMSWAEGKTDPANTTWADASSGAIFNYDLWEPGYVEVRHVKIENKGNLALKYDLKIVPTGEVSKLADVIDVYYFDSAVQVSDRSQLTAGQLIGTLAEFIAANETNDNTAAGNLLTGENHTVTLAMKMRESAGNEYQGLAIGSDFKLVLNATQLASEVDGFGNSDYDANASLPHSVWLVRDYAELKEAFAQGGTVKLMDNIAIEDSVAVPNGVAVDFDMNGKTLAVDPSFNNNMLIDMAAGSSLVISGNGIVDMGEHYMAFVFPRGDLTIENGSFIRKYKPDIDKNPDIDLFPLFMGMTKGNGNITINGGYFDSGCYRENDCYLNCIACVNISGGIYRVYGGTFVAQNPAWGDEGKGAMCPHCEKNGSGCQGVFFEGQTTTSTELPDGYSITEGVTNDGTNRPTYTVTYSKP